MNWHKTSEELPRMREDGTRCSDPVVCAYDVKDFHGNPRCNYIIGHYWHDRNRWDIATRDPDRWAYIEEPDETCKWTHRIDQYGYGQCSTSCGHGVLDEDRWRGMVYCAFCGKRIEYVEVEP